MRLLRLLLFASLCYDKHMKVLGITAEYNPFHNGHKYHLQRSMEETGADFCVAVMSGNFTQRGEAAILDKWSRSRIAVENGIDLVVELPFIFACNRAEIFAAGAVDILMGLGATHISFGSEKGDIESLKSLAADIQAHEEELEEVRQEAMKGGCSYAKGSFTAAERLFGKERAALMLEPNNILAIEYLKRLMYHEKRGRAAAAVTVKRFGSGYFEENRSMGFAGASVIRKLASEGKLSEAQRYMPQNAAAAMRKESSGVSVYENIFQLVRAEIVKRSSSELSGIYCMGEGIENRFKKEIMTAQGYQELVSAMVSRRYTEAAVRRLMIYIMLGVRKTHEKHAAVYGRVLAAGEKGRSLLRELKRSELASVPIITNINKETQYSDHVRETLECDILASDMYNIINNRPMYLYSDKVVKPYIKQRTEPV